MTTRKQQRLATMRAVIAKNRSLHVKAAAELLGVSEMTVRRDIQENAAEFDYLGGHIVLVNDPAHRQPYDLGLAFDRNKSAKRAACEHCLPLIQSADTIFVDCGTTLVHLIDLLPDDLTITVVCYALNVVDRVVRKPNLKLVLIGGEYHAETASFSLLKDDTAFSTLSFNIGFFSAAGLDVTLGASCSSFHEAIQKRAAMDRSLQKILVIDSSKTGQTRAAKFADMREFDQIYTENGPLNL